MTFPIVSKSIFHVEDSKAARILEHEGREANYACSDFDSFNDWNDAIHGDGVVRGI